ncbi:TM1812 family CRISPR-associated protein [Saccharolobus caldissimus]|uniref:CRISPR-associated protein n=1 Tax=Saccharolobus caldissimus TaxID=1702097 RepID=A0AAQ4CRY9_9CREN|nr:TM1812 family CRISPR-associated protein [Saccharolobus caldissimus]BDB98570.1 CRISPR-associated protein [Saccharolobus caldissimus]
MVYIATWGDPLGWSIAEYNSDWGKIKCWTTLPLSEGRSIIIVFYSAIFAKPREGNVLYSFCDEAKKALSKANERVNRGDDIRDIVRDYFYDLLKCLNKCNKPVSDVEVIPIPNLGKVSGVSFEITTEAMRGLLYAELYKRLKGENEIVLDITHGINYLTAITLNVIQQLSALLGAKLRVINAVPITQTEFEIETVAKFNKDSFNLQDLENTDVINSIKLNAPLPLIYLCRRNRKRFEIPEIKFIKEDIKSQFSLKDKRVLGELKESVILSRIVEDYVCDKINTYDDPFKVESLHEITELFERFYSISKSLIINELNNITNKKKSGMVYEILEQPREDCNSMMKSIDQTRRNFIAHGGFLKEFTYYDHKMNRIYYKINDECYGNVLNKILGFNIYGLIERG